MRFTAAAEQQPLLDTGGGGGGGGSAGGGGEAVGKTDATSAGTGNEGAGATLCKSAGRALIRMISTAPGHDEDEDFDIMGKVTDSHTPTHTHRQASQTNTHND